MRPSSLPPVKQQRTQFPLADHSADLPEGEERDQCDKEDNPDKQRYKANGKRYLGASPSKKSVQRLKMTVGNPAGARQ